MGPNITNLDQLENGDAIAFWNSGRSAYIFLDRKDGKPAYMMRTALSLGEESSSNYYFIVNKTDNGKYTFQDKNGQYIPVFGKSENPRPSETAGEFTITPSGDKWLIQNPDGTYFNGNGNNAEFVGWNEAGSNSLYEIRKVTLQTATSYTFNFVDENGASISSAQLTTASSTLTIPTVAFYKPIKATSNGQEIAITENTISTASVVDNTITVVCTESLPFTITTDMSNATWYFLRMHNNNNKGFVKYDATAGKLVSFKEANINLFDNTQLWCITGSLKDGVKVYNKAYPELAMTVAEGQVNMTTDGTAWILTNSKPQDPSGLDNAFCLKSGSNYINYNSQTGAIAYWSSNDDGSSFVAMPYADQIEVIATELENSINSIPAQAVGAPKDLAAAKAAIEAFRTNPTEENYNAVQTALNESEKITFEPNKYYRLESVYSRGKYMEIQNGSATASTLNKANASQIWNFSSIDDTHYNMSAQGVYTIAATKGSTPITTTTESADASQYSFNSREKIAQFGITPTNGLELHYNGGSNIVGWNGGNGSSWYIIQAKDINVTIGKTGYATVNYPFAVQIPQNITAYTGSIDTENKTFTLSKITDGIIPANTPVVLEGTPDTYTLTILANDATTSEVTKSLSGTLLSENISTEINAYILGNGTQGIGFYQMNTDDRTLGANKAYLALSASMSGVRSITIGGPTTGIEDTVAEGAAAEEYYDLQGRRVMNPTKGIYVTKSGKKVIFNK